MEKNIAALMREDTRTVHVSLDHAVIPSLADFAAPLLKSMTKQEIAKAYNSAYRGSVGAEADDFDDDMPIVTSRPKSPGAKTYTYVTNLALGIGDTVVVDADGQLKLASVRHVDEECAIEPNSTTKFKWVLAKVDLAPAHDNARRNAEIEEAVNNAYRQNLRRGFAQQVLAGIDDASREKLTALIGGAK